MAKGKTGASPGQLTGRPNGDGRLRLTLVRSRFGRLANHKACVAGLGLRRMHQTVEVADTPENRGMVNRIAYMLRIEQVQANER